MSRAFLKNDAAGQEVLIPPRAHLPPGVPNLVTPRGLAQLEAELAELTAERERLEESPAASDQTTQMAVLQGQTEELRHRIASAKVVSAPAQHEEVGFGATVRLRRVDRQANGQEHQFSIVGVDEAATAEGRVAFTAPIAVALIGHRVGDEVSFQTAREQQTLRILAVEYEAS
jgi:transcription elongation factor GreB